jgi:hypothetical protein
MKRTWALCLICSSLIWFPNEALSEDNFPKPPSVYVSQGSCPGECCVFRKWSVLKDTTLYDKPDGTRVVGVVKQGEWVSGLTGFVAIVPTRLRVVYPHVSSFDPQVSYRVGDILYMLTPMGEGARQVWFQGKLLPRGELLSHLDCSENDRLRCPKPSEECWAIIEGDCHERQMVWWVKVRTKKNIEGWVKELSGAGQFYDDPHFGNKDSCG